MIWLCGSISMMPTLYHHDPLASGQIRTTSSAGGPTRIFCSLWASATSTKGCFRDGRLEDHGRSPWRNRLTRWFLLTVGFLRLIYAQISEVSSGCFPSFSAFHFLVYSIYIYYTLEIRRNSRGKSLWATRRFPQTLSNDCISKPSEATCCKCTKGGQIRSKDEQSYPKLLKSKLFKWNQLEHDGTYQYNMKLYESIWNY